MLSSVLFTILFVSCAYSQTLPATNNWERIGQYFLDASYETTIATAVANIVTGAITPQGQLALCTELVALLNSNLTALNESFTNTYTPVAGSIVQNAAWCDIADSNGRQIDRLEASAAVSLAAGFSMTTRDISRGYMFRKILATAAIEMNLTLLADNVYALGGFLGYLQGLGVAGQAVIALAQTQSATCNELGPLLAGLAQPANYLTFGLLATVQAKRAIIPNIRDNLMNFPALYARDLTKLGINPMNPMPDILDGIAADAKRHFFERLNRKVHTLLEFEGCFGNDNVTAQGSLRRNVIKRMYDLARDYFTTLEVEYIVDVTITRNLTATPPYYQFAVTINVVGTANATRVVEKLGSFISAFIDAYSHPATIAFITSVRSSDTATPNYYTVIYRAFAAPSVRGYDPRDLTKDRPTLGLPENTPDNTTNSEYRNVLDNFVNIRPADYNTATASLRTSLDTSVTAVGTARTALTNAETEYNGRASFDFAGRISAQVQTYSTGALALLTLRGQAASVGDEVKKAHLQLISRCRQDHAAQTVVVKNARVLSLGLQLEVIQLIADLNETDRSGCASTIPDWRLRTVTIDDYHTLAQNPGCVAIAKVLMKLHLLDRQLLVATSATAAAEARLDVLTTSVNNLAADFTAYSNSIQSVFTAPRTTADMLATLAEANFKARVNACIKTVVNGIFSTCTYDFATVGTSVNRKRHTVNANFDASVNVGVTVNEANERLHGALQICLSVHIGGDLSYFTAKPTSINIKRGIEQGQNVNSNVDTVFPESSSTTTGSSVVAFSFVTFAVMLVLALFV